MRLVVTSLLVGCSTDDVTLTGRLGDDSGADAPGLAGAEIEILDRATDESILVSTTDANGGFSLTLPAGVEIAAVVRSDETVTTSFVGASGFFDVSLADGSLYGLKPDVVAGWRADFQGCPGVDEPVVLLGVMAFTNLAGQEDGENPIVGGGRAELFLDEDDSLLSCYLDPDTATYSPKADRTGATGRFAIFGPPPGPATLDVVFEWAPGVFDTPGPLAVYVPDVDEELVIPYLPLNLELPY